MILIFLNFIKKGNVDQLSKSCAYAKKITLILMIDLLTGNYILKGLDFFKKQIPFVNQRMEGQLCYDIPSPKYGIEFLLKLNFDKFLDENIFNDLFIKKLILLKKAEDCNITRLEKLIKQKLKIEGLEENLKYQNENVKNIIKNIKSKYPEVEETWLEIEEELN